MGVTAERIIMAGCCDQPIPMQKEKSRLTLKTILNE